MEADEQLFAELERAVTQGLIGPASLRFQVDHAAGFLEGPGGVPDQAMDMGAGGGLPGLVLAWRHPAMSWILVDGRERATRFLTEAVDRLELGDRVRVITARTEELGRDEDFRESVSLVTARSYGPPAVVAEGAAGVLALGGRLIVSEPPIEPAGVSRWPDEPLQQLGLQCGPAYRTDAGGYQIIEKVAGLSDRYPRRTGVVKKKPLF